MINARIKFNLPYGNDLSEDDKRELEKELVKELQSFGGYKDPNDWLFHSLQDVEVFIR